MLKRSYYVNSDMSMTSNNRGHFASQSNSFNVQKEKKIQEHNIFHLLNIHLMIIIHLHLYKYVHRVCLKKDNNKWQHVASQNKQGKLPITLKIIWILFNVPYFTNKHFRCGPFIFTLVFLWVPRFGEVPKSYLWNTVGRLLHRDSMMGLWCVCPRVELFVAKCAPRHAGTKRG